MSLTFQAHHVAETVATVSVPEVGQGHGPNVTTAVQASVLSSELDVCELEVHP